MISQPLTGAMPYRDALTSTLINGPQTPMNASGGGMGGISPAILSMLIQKRLGQPPAPSAPSNTIPGTGLFGTNIRGMPYAHGAAPGPNQIEPM